MDARALESFKGNLNNGWPYTFIKDKKYQYQKQNNIYHVIDEYGVDVPFLKEEFQELFWEESQ